MGFDGHRSNGGKSEASSGNGEDVFFGNSVVIVHLNQDRLRFKKSVNMETNENCDKARLLSLIKRWW